MRRAASLQYEPLAGDIASRARLGCVTTPHGSFDTPAFMPVGTQGSVKGILPDHIAASGAQIILANTYHLMLRPGEAVVAELGDLHQFMGWPGPILTDSGGFQVFSLADLNKIDDEGVTFRSHVDGSIVRLTPERSMAVQNALGADIIMMFDQCPPSFPSSPSSSSAPSPGNPGEGRGEGFGPSINAPHPNPLPDCRARVKSGEGSLSLYEEAVRRTLLWAERCVRSHGRPAEQALFGIVQGGTDLALRQHCAAELIKFDLSGYALGGLAVGESYDDMVRVLNNITPLLPADKPRYLMGTGYPRDILAAVAAGVDMFDCVLPTRNGRNAYAFTAAGAIRLRNSRFTRDSGPIEAGCDCYGCRLFSRGAIRHFFFAGEMLGPILVSVHNMRFYQRLMADIRQAIGEGRFAEFARTDPRRLIEPAERSQSAEAAEAAQAEAEAPETTPAAENGKEDSV